MRLSKKTRIKRYAGGGFTSTAGIGMDKPGPVNEMEMIEKDKGQRFSNVLGTAGKGASLGASIGSVIPGVGTAVGAVVGGLGGAALGLFTNKAEEKKRKKANEEIARLNEEARKQKSKEWQQYATAEDQYNVQHAQDMGYSQTGSSDAQFYGKKGGIHIKPENKGKFTATKKKTGKSTEELTHSKNPLTRKRAIFAQNAKKWKHAEGGPVEKVDEAKTTQSKEVAKKNVNIPKEEYVPSPEGELYATKSGFVGAEAGIPLKKGYLSGDVGFWKDPETGKYMPAMSKVTYSHNVNPNLSLSGGFDPMNKSFNIGLRKTFALGGEDPKTAKQRAEASRKARAERFKNTPANLDEKLRQEQIEAEKNEYGLPAGDQKSKYVKPVHMPKYRSEYAEGGLNYKGLPLKTNPFKFEGGGLSRSEDYGSSKKPYPSVKSSDFAGSGRSYPIPTKADAIDALRLAGLHGRSDVKAKVYSKYPELKHAAGGFSYKFQEGGEEPKTTRIVETHKSAGKPIVPDFSNLSDDKKPKDVRGFMLSPSERKYLSQFPAESQFYKDAFNELTRYTPGNPKTPTMLAAEGKKEAEAQRMFNQLYTPERNLTAPKTQAMYDAYKTQKAAEVAAMKDKTTLGIKKIQDTNEQNTAAYDRINQTKAARNINTSQEQIKKQQSTLEQTGVNQKYEYENIPQDTTITKRMGGPIYKKGGRLDSINSNTRKAIGATHEEGGIDLSRNAEIENREVVTDKGDQYFITSAKLTNPLTGRTFAKDDEIISRKIGKMEKKEPSKEKNNAMKLLNRKKEQLHNIQQQMNGNYGAEEGAPEEGQQFNLGGSDPTWKKRQSGNRPYYYTPEGGAPNMPVMRMGGRVQYGLGGAPGINMDSAGGGAAGMIGGLAGGLLEGIGAIGGALIANKQANKYKPKSTLGTPTVGAQNTMAYGGKIKYQPGGVGISGIGGLRNGLGSWQGIGANPSSNVGIKGIDPYLGGAQTGVGIGDITGGRSIVKPSFGGASSLPDVASAGGEGKGAAIAGLAGKALGAIANYGTSIAEYANQRKAIKRLEALKIPEPILQAGINLQRQNMDVDRANIARDVSAANIATERGMTDSNAAAAVRAANLSKGLQAKAGVNQAERNINREIANQEAQMNLQSTKENKAMQMAKSQAEFEKQAQVIGMKSEAFSKLMENIRTGQNTDAAKKFAQNQFALDAYRLSPEERKGLSEYMKKSGGNLYGRPFRRGGRMSKLNC